MTGLDIGTGPVLPPTGTGRGAPLATPTALPGALLLVVGAGGPVPAPFFAEFAAAFFSAAIDAPTMRCSAARSCESASPSWLLPRAGLDAYTRETDCATLRDSTLILSSMMLVTASRSRVRLSHLACSACRQYRSNKGDLLNDKSCFEVRATDISPVALVWCCQCCCSARH